MKKTFTKLNISLELENDIIMVREISTLNLLKAKTFPVSEAVTKFNELVKIYAEKEAKISNY